MWYHLVMADDTRTATQVQDEIARRLSDGGTPYDADVQALAREYQTAGRLGL